MVRRMLRSLFVLFLVVLSVPGFAQAHRSDAEKAASKSGWDDAWAWGNAFAVKTYFEQLYYPHAVALLDAESQLTNGKSAEEVAKSLTTLPGVKGAVITRSSGASAQFPENTADLKVFTSELFRSFADRHFGSSLAPMMHRTVGGKVRFAQAPAAGEKKADLLVRFLLSDTTKPPADAIALVMDQKWLIAKIPAVMDSLYNENVQLLFAAASPLNKIWEQSLGIVAGKDTLWWVGRKDVKISNEQVLWPFEDIRVPSYVHSLDKK